MTLRSGGGSGVGGGAGGAYGVSPGLGRKLVLLGDSITRMNTDGQTNLKSAYWGPRGAWSWAQVRLGFPFYRNRRRHSR